MEAKLTETETIIEIPMQRGDNIVLSNFVSFKGEGFDGEKEHFAIIFGDLEKNDIPIVRIHSECMTGDLFSSRRCDCGDQLNEAIDLMVKNGGIILYLRQEGRGIGLYNKFKAYKLQDTGLNTFEANLELGLEKDSRDFKIAADMLKALGKKNVFLLSNNDNKKHQLMENGINVLKMIPTNVYVNIHNKKYLEAKKNHANHNINFNSKNL